MTLLLCFQLTRYGNTNNKNIFNRFEIDITFYDYYIFVTVILGLCKGKKMQIFLKGVSNIFIDRHHMERRLILVDIEKKIGKNDKNKCKWLVGNMWAYFIFFLS